MHNKNKIAVVIIPTYNEVDIIKKIIDYLFNKTFKSIKNWNLKILIVDGNSIDGTSDVVKGLQKKHPDLYCLLEEKKEGIGAAYIKGFKYAINKLKAKVLIEFDGDFQHPPETIPLILEEIGNGYDYVIGSRKIKGGAFPKGWGLKRYLFSRVGCFVARFLLFFPFKPFFQITDPTTGLKATKVNKKYYNIDLDNLYTKDFGYKYELLYQMVVNGAKIKEIPLDFKIRTSGESKINIKITKEIFKTVFYLRAHDKKTIKFIKFGLEFINCIFKTFNISSANTFFFFFQ